MSKQSPEPKPPIFGILLSLFGTVFFLFLVQILVSPRPPLHANFPYITLNDKDLPFFNKASFQKKLYSWYALDTWIASQIANDKPAFENLSAKEFSQVIKTVNPSPGQSPLKDYFNQASDQLIYPININAMGFRGKEIQRQKQVKTLRIVAAGDSLTFGFGLSEKDTWVKLLEDRLNKIAPSGTTVEVINAGVISFDSTLGMELIRTKVLPLKPDWLLIGYGFNDYNFNNQSFLRHQKDKSQNDWQEKIRRKKTLAGQITYGLNSLRVVQLLRTGLKSVTQKKAKNKPLAFSQMKSHLEGIRNKHGTSLETYATNYTDMLTELDKKGIKVLLLHSNIPSPFYLETLEKTAQKHEVALEDFRAIFSRELKLSRHFKANQKTETLFQVAIQPEQISADNDVYVLGDYFSAVEFGLTPLSDDGLNGDLKKGDHIYSAKIPILDGTTLSFRFGVHAPESDTWREEFEGWRIYRRFDVYGGNNAQTITPVYEYNGLKDHAYKDYAFEPLMAETCHPNRKGNGVIARVLAIRLQQELGW